MSTKVKTSVVALATGLSLMLASGASSAMDKQVERALVKVCKSAASNKPIRMKVAMDDYNLKAHDVALKVMCNGDDIITFAESRGAFKTASRLQNSIGGVEIIDVAATDKIYVNFVE
ncbi:DUF3718 domain-containing protein [Thalassotalea euphylliae]|uniref:DUF3718 domain-containing protein n=1 Tax=Thalassotalea euphylliae TaxID=1655234 RepID=A0A3E0TP86_9GAMM|nr:DUF3718 domain-containing protein [Thalassotalea euphylliae]REL25805.1 DUF3718 domain-containing protein [Thalassotalea euphylliae]